MSVTVDEAVPGAASVPRGRSPWRIAGRGLVHNRSAMALVRRAGADRPLRARRALVRRARRPHGPVRLEREREDDRQRRDRRRRPAEPVRARLDADRPDARAAYFLGADSQGRDVAARILYGGRASLSIGILAALIALTIATLLGIVAGLYGGWLDGFISRFLDLIGRSRLPARDLARDGPARPGDRARADHHRRGEPWLPAVIIGLIYVPYLRAPSGARSSRCARQEFVDAAIAQGASNPRLVFERAAAERRADADRLPPR